MLFSNMFYKPHRSPLSKLRQHMPGPEDPTMSTEPSSQWDAPEYADLFSRDKVRLKAAVKNYVARRVRNDWDFVWSPPERKQRHADAAVAAAHAATTAAPTPISHPERLEQRDPANIQDEVHDDAGYQVDSDADDALDSAADAHDSNDDDDARSVYSIVSDDPARYKPRIEWDSDYPADEDTTPPAPSRHSAGLDDEETKARRRAQQRRDLRKEMQWNPGLACFEARRNAWTDARVVQLRPKAETPMAASPTSQRSSRRRFFRRSVSSTSSAGAHSQLGTSPAHGERSPQRESENKRSKTDKASHSESSENGSYPVETIIPVAPPILPPQCLLRAGIQPENYLKLYDKCILDNQQPACPVNLSDTINALVLGWKRDGEWPPRPAIPNDFPQRMVKQTPATSERRKSLTGFLVRDRTAESRAGKGVRQSISRAFGLGTHLDNPAGPRPTMAG